MNRFLKDAIEEARKSVHIHRVGAVIFEKKRIVSKGYNVPQKSVRNLHPRFMSFKGSIHAEVNAILKAHTNLKGLQMLVVRINRKDQLRFSKPCSYCLAYLEYVGIKKVFYSLNEYPYIDSITL